MIYQRYDYSFEALLSRNQRKVTRQNIKYFVGREVWFESLSTGNLYKGVVIRTIIELGINVYEIVGDNCQINLYERHWNKYFLFYIKLKLVDFL